MRENGKFITKASQVIIVYIFIYLGWPYIRKTRYWNINDVEGKYNVSIKANINRSEDADFIYDIQV